jgi:hypothetical protein
MSAVDQGRIVGISRPTHVGLRDPVYLSDERANQDYCPVLTSVYMMCLAG